MRIENYLKPWRCYEGLSGMLVIAAINLIVLSAQSCASQKKFSQDTRITTNDSVLDFTTITTKILTVPLSQASLRLDLANVANLTPGAVFTDKNGQASIKLQRRGDTIYITATCDSLQMLVESRDREITHLRTLVDKQSTVIEKPPNWWQRFKNNAFYILVGMGLMLLLILIKKIWQKIRVPINLPRWNRSVDSRKRQR